MRRASFWCAWATLGYLGLMGIAQVQAQTDVDRRIGELEKVHADVRLAVVEARLDSIEFLGKAILGGVVGQLVISGMNFRSRKSQGDLSRRIFPPSST